MALIIIDIITSVLQSIIFAYTVTYCIEKKEKIDKIKLFAISLLFIFVSIFLLELFGDNFAICVFVTHILALCIVAIHFIEKILVSAITAYTIIYCYSRNICYYIW